MNEKKIFKLPHGGDVILNINSGYVQIECAISQNIYPSGKKLYVITNGGDSLCVGGFSPSGGSLFLKKTYSMSYFASNRIYTDDIFGFEVDYEEAENTSLQSAIEKDKDIDYTKDFAYSRAREVLDSLKSKHDYSFVAGEIRKEISAKLKVYEKTEMNFLKDYIWYEITDIRETFGLSSLEHIIFNEFFVRAYAKSGKWFFGCTNDKGMYAVCISCTTELPNPMANALDCCRVFKNEGTNEICYVVGVGVFDDGQYFYKADK